MMERSPNSPSDRLVVRRARAYSGSARMSRRSGVTTLLAMGRYPTERSFFVNCLLVGSLVAALVFVGYVIWVFVHLKGQSIELGLLGMLIPTARLRRQEPA